MRAQIHKHYYLYAFVFGMAMSLSLFVLIKPSASAATINVVAGTDAISDNNQCQLSEAIQNINNQAQTNFDCPAGNGNNDTINLPAGTITLTQQIQDVIVPIIIQGQGVDQTIINGSGAYKVFTIEQANGESTISDMTITAFSGFGIQTNLTNININNLEIDGAGSVATPNSIHGIFISGGSAQVRDVYIHSIAGNPNGGMGAIGLAAVQGNTVNADIDRVTIKDISSNTSFVAAINAVTGFLDGSGSQGIITVDVTNSTISGVASTNNNATGIVGLAAVFTSVESQITINATNTTITDIDSGSGMWGVDNSAISSLGIAAGPDSVATVTINSRNNIYNSGAFSCLKGGDVAQGAGLPDPSTGTITETITSLGGNISDDESCNDYFNQNTDKNNITNLSDFLGSLANNGGTVPTMALLPGSPAIDGGVCTEDTPDTDARGFSRPQGKTCDSGAFEVEQAAPTGTVPGGKAVALNVPAGVVVKQFGTASGNIPADNAGDAEYEFPMGLLGFELGVIEGSANEISLDFESDLEPEAVVARKYNPSDQTYTSLEGAVVTKVTKDNKPHLRLAYSITDGQFPDLDNQANGTIVDPIGLATEKQGILANTGELVILAIPTGTILLLAALTVTYLDYRKHKKPLIEADQQLAQSYTYWHHLKTVTVPLFSYRFSLAFERKQGARQGVVS